MTEKRCPRCDQWKPVGEFNRARNRADGLQLHCRPCQHLYGRATYQRHRERYNNRDKALWQRKVLAAFGMTVEDYEVMLEAQGRACAICRQSCERGRLAVDHDHATGLFRGLLCRNCNLALGFFTDQPDLLEAAARYLRKAALKQAVVGE